MVSQRILADRYRDSIDWARTGDNPSEEYGELAWAFTLIVGKVAGLELDDDDTGLIVGDILDRAGPVVAAAVQARLTALAG
jgi:hypothetical protein